MLINIYRPGKCGLQLVDINGNHIYKDYATNKRINSFLDSYIKNYFIGCYYEKTNMISTVASLIDTDTFIDYEPHQSSQTCH